ncbi:peptidase [Peromfec virus RodF5_5]|uniref:Peptidase n=1 Tax=Peromfec virus RodF5_5 TaxID=2929341 RepID=A0A976N293_9VIRU|nr:peptidase [Peromfec virus RodF5_5]
MSLSDNFTLHELVNTSVPDGIVDNLRSITTEQLSNLLSLCTFLQYLRSAFQVPIKINSAFRSPHVNSSVGGVPTSNHLKGLAADLAFTWSDSKQSDILNFLFKCKSTGLLTEVIKYTSFVHIAIHPEHVEDKKYYPLPF